MGGTTYGIAPSVSRNGVLSSGQIHYLPSPTLAFIRVGLPCVYYNSSNCLAHHILSIVALPYAYRRCPSRVALRDESVVFNPVIQPAFFYILFFSFIVLLTSPFPFSPPSTALRPLFTAHCPSSFCS